MAYGVTQGHRERPAGESLRPDDPHYDRVGTVSDRLGVRGRARPVRSTEGRKAQRGSYDLRIAAIALELGATVVTRNLRDFNRIPGPTCEDWSA
jgi:predicted nucleic acid-binding protein